MFDNPMSEAARMTRARSRLLLDFPWFGTLALRLSIQPNTAQETMRTDGTHLEYNPTWTATLSDPELTGVIAHETMHCAMLHPYRTAGRKLDMWNRACDLAINPLLRASGLTLPADAMDDPQYADMAAEQIYAALAHDEPEPEPGKGKGCGNSPTGDFVPAPTPQPDDEPGDDDQPGDGPAPTPQPMTATDWQVVAEQAASVARKQGNMPGDVHRAIKEIREGQVDWRTILRRFVEQTTPSDYSWTSPNRRYVAAGIYLPGTVKENTPRLAVAIDTSGSVSQDMLDAFASELTAIMLETRPAAIDVVYCDARIRSVETFTPDDGEITLTPQGGGGTSFQPVIDWVDEQDEPPAALIYCTDLEAPVPTEPGCPVLWVVPEWVRKEGAFGETVKVRLPL